MTQACLASVSLLHAMPSGRAVWGFCIFVGRRQISSTCSLKGDITPLRTAPPDYYLICRPAHVITLYFNISSKIFYQQLYIHTRRMLSKNEFLAEFIFCQWQVAWEAKQHKCPNANWIFKMSPLASAWSARSQAALCCRLGAPCLAHLTGSSGTKVAFPLTSELLSCVSTCVIHELWCLAAVLWCEAPMSCRSLLKTPGLWPCNEKIMDWC